VNKNPTDATVCRYLFTAKLLYIFRVSQHSIKTVPAASGTGHTTCTATPLQSGLIGTPSILCYITHRTLSLRSHRNRVIEILYIYVCIYFQTFVKECQYTVLINYGRRQNYKRDLGVTCNDLLYVGYYAVYINLPIATRKRLAWDNLKILLEVNVHKLIRISNKKKPNLIIVFQQDANYSVYYISVDNSTCFGCRQPSSGAGTAEIAASGID